MLEKTFICYLFLPFVAAFFGHVLVNLKNKITLRFTAKALSILNFFVFAGLFFVNPEKNFSIFNISFVLNDANLIFLLFNSIIFLIFAFLSKTFIQKFAKIFFSNFILYLGLINIFLLTDNIIFTFACLFVIFLLNCLFYSTYSKTKENKDEARKQFIFDFLLLFSALFLVAFDFVRYFTVNNIEFTYSNIKLCLPYISDGAQITAFFGFFIVFLRLFNFFAGYNFIKQIDKTNNYAICLSSILSILTGGYYFINMYGNFDFLFFKFQNYIALFLILNLFYNALLSFGKDNILKNVFFLLFTNISFSIFIFFTFDQAAKNLFIYYLFSVLFSYLLLEIVLIIQQRKIKSLDFNNIMCGLVKNRNICFITLFSLLNISFIPLLCMFMAAVALFSNILIVQYDSLFLNYCAYILLFGLFVANLSIYNLIYKILIEPSKPADCEINFAFHQRFCTVLLIFLNLLFGIFGFCLLNNMMG